MDAKRQSTRMNCAESTEDTESAEKKFFLFFSAPSASLRNPFVQIRVSHRFVINMIDEV